MEYIPLPSKPMEPVKPMEKTLQERLLEVAESFLGKDVSETILGVDTVPDEVGCVETVTLLMRQMPELRDFPLLTYTPHLVSHLKQDARFQGTMLLEPGSIIVNATGTGNGRIQGHTGIIGRDGKIISNSSPTGKLEENFTIDSWKQRYRIFGGMPTLVFKIKEPV